MKTPEHYAPLLRSDNVEKEIVSELKVLPEADRLAFLLGLMPLQSTATRAIARRTPLKRQSLVELVGQGLESADASEIRDWLVLGSQRLGPRGLLYLLDNLAESNPAVAHTSIYWLGEAVPKKELRDEIEALKKKLARLAPKSGQHYTDDEIYEIVRLAAASPDPHSPALVHALAARLGRSAGAIDFVIRWWEGAHFPKRAPGQIKRQVEAARQRLEAGPA